MDTYVVYKHGVYMGEGTFEELAEITGRTEYTLRKIRSKGSNIWEIVSKRECIDFGEVDNDKILSLLKEFDYTQNEIAQLLGIAKSAVSARLRDTLRWREPEIEELEDLFFLEEGELLK